MNNIKYLVMDVDGTLTDGKIYMGETGELCKAFHVKDGYGIHEIAIPAGLVPVIITGRSSTILTNRCEELGIKEVHQGVSDKEKKIREIVQDLCTVAYIGDDLNDFLCMSAVKDAGGVIGCPADAVKEVKDLANFISVKDGGEGAVRDFIEWIMRGKR